MLGREEVRRSVECTSPPRLWLKRQTSRVPASLSFHRSSSIPSDSEPGEVSKRCRAERRRRGRVWARKSAKALVLLLNCPIYFYLSQCYVPQIIIIPHIFYCFIWRCCHLFVVVAFRLVVVFVIVQINPCDQDLQPPTMDHHL